MPPVPKPNHAPIVLSLFALVTVAFVFPAYVSGQNSQLLKDTAGEKGLSTTADRALPINSVRRGPFINSGSRDVGLDTNWKGGVYTKKYNSQEAYRKEIGEGEVKR